MYIIRDIEINKITNDPLDGDSLIIQKFFDDIFDGLETVTLDDYLESIFFVKNGIDFYMEQDYKNDHLYCSYDRFWSFFDINFGYVYEETQHLIKYMVEEQLKSRVSTPGFVDYVSLSAVEEQFKSRVSTPYTGTSNEYRKVVE